MALPFLEQTDTTHSVNILRGLHCFPGQGVLRVVILGLGIAGVQMVSVLHSCYWHKTGGELCLPLNTNKTLIQCFLHTTDRSVYQRCPALLQASFRGKTRGTMRKKTSSKTMRCCSSIQFTLGQKHRASFSSTAKCPSPFSAQLLF